MKLLDYVLFLRGDFLAKTGVMDKCSCLSVGFISIMSL